MLSRITPVLLTYNEAPNISRAVSCLTWAADVVVVDSGSTDETLSMLAKFPNVRVFARPFDTHDNQWRFAVTETQIATPWILRLDADYQLSEELVKEMEALDPDTPIDAYRIAFDYAVFSQRIRTSLYPPNTILLRGGKFSVLDDGHTEAWKVDGPIGVLQGRVLHDDWKTTGFWLTAQSRYMRREFDKIAGRRSGLKDWLRLRPPLAPFLVFVYCLFGKGLIFNGRAGLFYALQRMVAEAVLSLMVLEAKLRAKADSAPPGDYDS
ncbi:MAG TPA: glycosyltransferase family 2 protein [Xanthobacteraceae bacterium]|jgi:glycosyltransferase involved in cell wall biosynthesis